MYDLVQINCKTYQNTIHENYASFSSSKNITTLNELIFFLLSNKSYNYEENVINLKYKI